MVGNLPSLQTVTTAEPSYHHRPQWYSCSHLCPLLRWFTCIALAYGRYRTTGQHPSSTPERNISTDPSRLAQKESKMPVSIKALQQMAIYLGVVSGGGCCIMYYYMQKNFARKEYYLSALEQLSGHSVALDALGAPPLKVHNIRLTDRRNRVDKSTAQIKIPVSGMKSGGYLYTSSVRDISHNRWCLQEVILQLRDGQRIPIYFSPVSNEDLEQD